MEEIDISQLIDYFRSKIIYIIFAMAVAFCLSSIYVNKFLVPVYTSSTTILLNQANDNNAISSSDVSLNKSLISTYSSIIKSKKVLNQVINNLSLDYEYETLYSEISVSEITDTTIVKVSVTDKDNNLAAKVANEIAKVFNVEIENFLKIENVSVIDEAEVSEVPSGTSTIKIVGVATVAGAVLAVGILFVLFYFDTSIKNEEEIERALGLPVIGVVPISSQKIKGSLHRKYYDDIAKHHKSSVVLPVERELRKIEVEKKNTEKRLVDRDHEIDLTRIIPTVEEDNIKNTDKKILDEKIDTAAIPVIEEAKKLTQDLKYNEETKTDPPDKTEDRLSPKGKNEVLNDYFQKIEANRIKQSSQNNNQNNQKSKNNNQKNSDTKDEEVKKIE